MKNIFKGRWLLTGAFVLIAGLAGCANTGEKTGAYVDDSWITSKVKSEMVADKDVSARNINVITTKGVVKLTGTVKTLDESNKAAQIAHSVEGVKQVENNLQVQL
jgi:osmotically-inducible protein OsmY